MIIVFQWETNLCHGILISYAVSRHFVHVNILILIYNFGEL